MITFVISVMRQELYSLVQPMMLQDRSLKTPLLVCMMLQTVKPVLLVKKQERHLLIISGRRLRSS